MEKKDLKMYEAPAVEVVKVEAQSIICASEDEWLGPDIEGNENGKG